MVSPDTRMLPKLFSLLMKVSQNNFEKQILRVARLFQGLNEEALESCVASALRIEKTPGEIFFQQGDQAKRFFLLCRGRVKVTQITPEGHQVVARYAGQGQMFGCVPMYGGKEYPATATAVTRSTALAWDRATTDRLMGQYPRVAISALQILGDELAEVRLRYQELATERVEQRVARALVRLVRQAGKKVDAGVLIEFPLSRQDLAELTGTTLHTVSRILSGWEDEGVIQSGRRRIVIRKPHRLVSLAEDLLP
jgi:CRP/FNR family transcriptional regulator, nitrogen oxide reductase regulator